MILALGQSNNLAKVNSKASLKGVYPTPCILVLDKYCEHASFSYDFKRNQQQPTFVTHSQSPSEKTNDGGSYKE